MLYFFHSSNWIHLQCNAEQTFSGMYDKSLAFACKYILVNALTDVKRAADIALVRPALENVSLVWDLLSNKNTAKLKTVERLVFESSKAWQCLHVRKLLRQNTRMHHQHGLRPRTGTTTTKKKSGQANADVWNTAWISGNRHWFVRPSDRRTRAQHRTYQFSATMSVYNTSFPRTIWE